MCGQLTQGLVVIQGMENQISGVVCKVGFLMLIVFSMSEVTSSAFLFLFLV